MAAAQMPAPLFMFGLPRSGTNLLTRALNVHPQVMVAIHGFQPLFKSLRAAAIRDLAAPDLCSQIDAAAPVHDGHFDLAQRAILDTVHAATLDLRFLPADAPKLAERLVSRASDDASDLCDGMAGLLDAPDYRAIFDAALALVAAKRRAETRKWVGMIDTWVMDLMPAVARAYPNAKFIAIERDPRAIVNSILGFMKVDPTQVGHVLSVVRHWRKEGAVLQKFAADPAIGPRLLRVHYEDMVADASACVRRACAFLDIDFRPEMVAFDEFVDAPTGRKWSGNSTFDSTLGDISKTPADRWRKTLPRGARDLVEFAAGRDMKMRGYADLAVPENAAALAASALSFMVEDGDRIGGWRCDSGDALAEFAWETLRAEFLAADAGGLADAHAQRCFLYRPYFDALRKFA